jgi:hypothetical protein
MIPRPLLRGSLALALGLSSVSRASAQDPCLLTLTEARELGGSEITQAAGDGRRCSYVVKGGETRIAIDVGGVDSPAAQTRLEELGDASRYDSRQKGKVTYWLSRADELAGWVRRGERLAEVRSDGEASAKRRRLLEHALQRVGERLR